MMRTDQSSIMYEFIEACGLEGCPVCRLAVRTSDRYFDILAYENTNDIDVRNELRASRGFCNRHAWQYAEHHDSLGAAIVYRDVLRSLLRDMPDTHGERPFHGIRKAVQRWLDPDGSRAHTQLLHHLAPHGRCIACRREETTCNDVIDVLSHRVQEPSMASAFADSAGLCQRHLAVALPRVRRPDARVALLAAQQKAWLRARERVASGAAAPGVAILAGNTEPT